MASERRDRWVRWKTLKELESWLETPMLVLSFVWLALVLAELIGGGSGLLESMGTAIWLVFFAEFALRLTLAPGKLLFLKRNWLTAIALALPALRIFRALRLVRLARAARSIRLVKIVGTANRGMNALRRTMVQRGFGYVVLLTAVIDVLGAAGMWALEGGGEEPPFTSYADALWWTSMILVTMGTDFWPTTAEGRVLCLLLAVYGFAIFGYITAVLATFFLGQEAGRGVKR